MERKEQQSLKVIRRDPKRYSVNAYLDFLDCPLLSLEEKVIFLCLKKYLDFRKDLSGERDVISPSLYDIQKMVGASLPTIVKYIASLEKKGVIEKRVRGLNQTNLYILSDRPEMWSLRNTPDDLKYYARETDEERNIRIARQGGFTIEKEGELLPGNPYPVQDKQPDLYAGLDPGKLTGKSLVVKDRDAGRERLYVKVYFDFLESGLLNLREIGMFIMLKSYTNLKNDLNGIQQEAFPSIKTLEKKTGKGHSAVIAIIDSLVMKGVVERVHRFAGTNVYTITDRASMWASRSYEEVGERARETDVEAAARLLIEAGYKVTRASAPERDPEVGQEEPGDRPDGWQGGRMAGHSGEPVRGTTHGAPRTRGSVHSPSSPEPYTKDLLYESTGMAELIRQRDASSCPFYADEKELIDICMGIIQETMNSRRGTITVNGEAKPSSAVKGVFSKLDAESIVYAIGKFQSQTARIDRPTAYLRTILYNAALGERELSEINAVQKALYEDGYGTFTIESPRKK